MINFMKKGPEIIIIHVLTVYISYNTTIYILLCNYYKLVILHLLTSFLLMHAAKEVNTIIRFP